jgi:hypothetical protein
MAEKTICRVWLILAAFSFATTVMFGTFFIAHWLVIPQEVQASWSPKYLSLFLMLFVCIPVVVFSLYKDRKQIQYFRLAVRKQSDSTVEYYV